MEPDQEHIVGLRTPLSYAAREGCQEVVRVLLQTGCVYPNSKDAYGKTLLDSALANGHINVVDLIFDLG